MPFDRKAWREANKEKIAAQTKAYKEANKDKVKAHYKARYEANKKKVAAQYKEWSEANKGRLTAYHKAYLKTEAGIKSYRMKNWRGSGVNNVNDELYDYFMNCNNCEACGKEFTDTYNKCLDHDHDTGDFRYVLCRSCNSNDNWKKHITTI